MLRGILRSGRLDPAERREAAVLNHDLYDFYGISVWLAEDEDSRSELEATKLVKFEAYAEFTVANLSVRKLRLEATGQSPH
ncbi:MAG: hypothetical protein ACREQM_18605 [Candidatus Dormibacteraceae bacterium]